MIAAAGMEEGASRAAAPESLRAPGAVLLISCYELGHQPLGIASPLGFLQRAGFQPAALDISVERLDVAALEAARCVGISVPMHTALRLGVRVAERVRALNPECHVCFYGLYASLNAEYLLGHCADSVIGGEYEGPLVALVEALERGDAPTVEGVTRRSGAPERGAAGPGTPPPPPTGAPSAPSLRRQSFTLPVRDALPPLERYAQLERDGRRHLVGYVETSRGCKHLCGHCPIPPVYNGRFFVVPAEGVLEDVRRLVEAGAEHLTFGDPDFFNGPGHALRVARAVHAEFPRLTFDATIKVEHLLQHRALVPELRELGCLFIVSAVESLSGTVLHHLRKGHTRADVFQAVALVRAAGISLRPSLVSFTPWTTLEDYVDVLDWVARDGLVECVDPVQYAIRLLVPPGSSLLQSEAMTPFLGPLDAASLSYRWAHPDPRMDRLHSEMGQLVEAAARESEAPEVTFERVRELAHAYLPHRSAEAPGSGERVRAATPASRPPRLTEAWFC